MPDTGPARHSPSRSQRHRPPPLLVIAATGLAVVIALGITLLLFRGRGERDELPARPVAASSQASPALEPKSEILRENQTARAHLPEPAAAAPAPPPPPPSEVPAAEVPEWERKPLRTSQPFPEEARFDPPMPPIKIPPEMLLPPAAPDAAGVP